MHFYQPHQPNHLITPMLCEDDLQINSLYPSQSNPTAGYPPAMQGCLMQQPGYTMTGQCYVQPYNNLSLVSALLKLETAWTKRDIACLEREIKALQLDKARSADEAFSQATFHDGRFTVVGTRGQSITLCPIPLDFLCHILPEPAYGQEGYFLVRFRNRETHCIPGRYLAKPAKLLQALSAAAGESIKTCSNPRKIGGLLAQTLVAAATRIPLLYRYGWQKSQDNWLFYLCGGKTHCGQLPLDADALPQTMALTELDRGATLRSAAQIVKAFQVFQDTSLSQILFLWWNASFLYTLLLSGNEASSPLPMGLCLLCQSGRTARCLEMLFRWYGDSAISLGDDPKVFPLRLGQRADQPLLIRDSVCCKENETALLQALSSGSVPAGSQTDAVLQLRAPVTLLSEGKSPLCCSQNFFTMEITDQDLCTEILPKLPSLISYQQDYFRGLARFVQQNPEPLRTLMTREDTYVDFEDDEDYELSANGIQVLSTLRCVRSFLRAYLENLAPGKGLEQAILSLLSEDDYCLMDALEDSSTSQDDLTHVFLGIASRKMVNASLQLVNICQAVDAAVQTQPPVVYFNDKFCYFTLEAFRAICRDCHATTRAVLNSIAPLLEGTPYCSGSAMTRIPGDRRRTRAYQISRKHFYRPFVRSQI